MSDKKEPFPCDTCGLCCQKVGQSEQTQWLNRGDGVCRYYDEKTRLCTIYETRPLVCRVEDFYQTYLQDKISWRKFVRINIEVCQKFKNEDKK